MQVLAAPAGQHANINLSGLPVSRLPPRRSSSRLVRAPSASGMGPEQGEKNEQHQQMLAFDSGYILGILDRGLMEFRAL